jgi:hypothetical protein
MLYLSQSTLLLEVLQNANAQHFRNVDFPNLPVGSRNHQILEIEVRLISFLFDFGFAQNSAGACLRALSLLVTISPDNSGPVMPRFSQIFAAPPVQNFEN